MALILPGDTVEIAPDKTRDCALSMLVCATYPLRPGRVELRGLVDLAGRDRPAELTIRAAEQDVRVVSRGDGQPVVR